MSHQIDPQLIQICPTLINRCLPAKAAHLGIAQETGEALPLEKPIEHVGAGRKHDE